jgi:uncharacterized membrane protein YjjP (DUF1212 family)
MIKKILKVLCTVIVFGSLLTFILFLSIGDDNYLLIFAIIGLIVGTLTAIPLRNKYMNRNLAIVLISFFSFIALLLITYAVYGFIFGEDMITGNLYYEMGGMLPYLEFGTAIPFVFISITIALFIKRREL